MAGFIHHAGLLTPTATVSSGDASGFGKDNAADFTRPYKLWKSSGAVVSGTTYVGLDLGTTKAMAAVGVDNINIDTVKFQTSADAAVWIDATVSLTAYECAITGKYKLYATVSSSARYVRVLAQTSSTVDSETAMTVGALWATDTTKVTWTNATDTFGEEVVRAVGANQFRSGGRQISQDGEPFSVITLGAAAGFRTDLRAPMHALSRAGQGSHVVFYKNDDNGNAGEVWIYEVMQSARVRQVAPNAVSVPGMVLREVA